MPESSPAVIDEKSIIPKWLRDHAKLVRGILGSAVLALIVALILGAISVSGVTSMTAANADLWVAFAIFVVAILVIGVISCYEASRRKAWLIAVVLTLLGIAAFGGRRELSVWLYRAKSQAQLSTSSTSLRETPTSPVRPKMPNAPGGTARPSAHAPRNSSTADRQPTTKHISPKNPVALATIHIPGTVQQQTNAPCSGNAIGGSVDNTNCKAGYIPPSPRTLNNSNYDSAVALLRSARGSTFAFYTAGSSDEISSFEKQVRDLFVAAGWTEMPGSSSGSVYLQGGKATGLICASSNADKLSVAKQALGKMGFSCVNNPILLAMLYPMGPLDARTGPPPAPPDLVIMVATRISGPQ